MKQILKDCVGLATVTNLSEFRDWIESFTVSPERWVVVHDLEPIDNERWYSDLSPHEREFRFQRVARNLNMGRETILKMEKPPKFVFMIEQDASFPVNVLNDLHEAMDSETHLTSLAFGVRDNRLERKLMIGNFQLRDNVPVRYHMFHIASARELPKIAEIHASSFNCMLAKWEVIEKIPFWGVAEGTDFAVDTLFYARAKSLDFKHKCLVHITTEHRGFVWNYEKEDDHVDERG